MDKTGIQYQNVFISPKAYCMICLQVLRVYVTAGCRRITDLPVKLQLSFWAPIPCTSNRRKREKLGRVAERKGVCGAAKPSGGAPSGGGGFTREGGLAPSCRFPLISGSLVTQQGRHHHQDHYADG